MDRNLTLVVFIGHCQEFVVHPKWTSNRVIENKKKANIFTYGIATLPTLRNNIVYSQFMNL